MSINDALWDPSLSVGIKQFDDHHKHLFSILAALKEQLDSEYDKKFLKLILLELISYTKYHFKAEERIMLQNDYEYYEEHKNEHERLIDKIAVYIEKYSKSETIDQEELYTFMLEWWKEHIMKTDMKYSTYLKHRGVS